MSPPSLLAASGLNELFKWSIVKEMFPRIIVEGIRNTIVYTTIAFVGGLIIGLVLALGRISRRRWLRYPAATVVDVVRGLPALLTIVLIGYGLPIAYRGFTGNIWRWPFGELGSKFIPGGFALSIVAGAYLAESIRSGIEAIPKGQMEAARSLGMNPNQTMRKVILPQAFRIIIPPLTNELTALLKDTSLLAILGVQVGGREILTYVRALSNVRSNTTPLIVGGLAYLVITLPLLRLVGLLEKKAKGPAR
jgi:polar amino acid transport system permease protein